MLVTLRSDVHFVEYKLKIEKNWKRYEFLKLNNVSHKFHNYVYFKTFKKMLRLVNIRQLKLKNIIYKWDEDI